MPEFELVIIKAVKYKTGERVDREGLLEQSTEEFKRYLFWIDPAIPTKGAFSPMELAIKPIGNSGEGAMVCPMWRFEFVFLTNIRVRHTTVSYLYGEYLYQGAGMFKPFVDQFIQIANPRIEAKDYLFDCSFYGLFQIEWDEHRDEDGGLDTLDVYAEFRGEFDMSKAVFALAGLDIKAALKGEYKAATDILQEANKESGYIEDGIPFYSSRD